MSEYIFGGSKFNNCSIPLIFEDRVFIVEPDGSGLLVSVVFEYDGKLQSEILKNKPVENTATDVSATPAGIITVADRQTGHFIYKVRPGSETSIVFGTLKGDELSVVISDKQIRVGTNVIQNCAFNGVGVGVVVNKDGGFGIGASIPQWFSKYIAKKE